MPSTHVVADFETASHADLQKIGAWKYAADMSTFPICLSLKLIVDGKPKPAFCLSEAQLHGLDPRLMELANDPNVKFIVHNGGFEQGMWHFHMVPMGYPPLPPERWHDTMAVAAMKALPLGLDAVVSALELPVKKDMEGHRHMLMMCKPDKDGGWSHHTPENLQRLYDYCNSDVDAQYGVFVSTGPLGDSERHTWVLDQKINQRGILIDEEFVRACIDVLDQVRVPMTERFRELTGLRPTQREKVLDWINDQGVPLDNMRKATLDAILDPEDEFGFEFLDAFEPLPYHIHEVLQLRRSLASSSVAKLERMIQCAGSDWRVRYTTQYHGARTGRDAGRLIQVQNYPRGEISDRQGLTADALAEAILTRDLPTIRELWGDDIFTAVISSLRSCIVPEKGKVIVSGDFAAVEARNLLSMAGQHDRVEQMHAGLDVYSETASLIYKRPIQRKIQVKEGQIGKNTFLGSGYGLGPNGFRARFAPKESIELAKLAIDTYRNDIAPMVPKFWYGLFEASTNAAWCQASRAYSFSGIEFRKEQDFLTMRLPSGRKIWYHRPRPNRTIDPNGNERPSWTFMSYQGKKFRRHQAWHGQVTADCIQGSARDLMTEAMKRAEAAGLYTIFKVHDELVFEERDRPDLVQVVKEIMEDIEPWAIERKFRVKAEVEKMLRYRK